MLAPNWGGTRKKRNGLCKVNAISRRFEVNDQLEAAPPLYVNGLLLAGVFTRQFYYWHLESARRIREVGVILADRFT